MIITQTSHFDLVRQDRDDNRKKLSLLRAWAPLQRLQPVRLTAVNGQLQQCRSATAGLRLIEKHFPEALGQYSDLGQSNWWDILVDLGHLVEEAGWFEIDWEVLNEAWAYWLEYPSGNGDYLASFLCYIPLRLYGFNREPASIQIFNAEPGLFLEFFPPAELFYVLLDPSAAEVSPGLLVGAELYDQWDDWNEAGREAAWKRLHAIQAEPETYPDSVRWLPALAKWACGTTGNPILDWSISVYYEQDGERFSWETDVEKARAAWQEAQPVIAQFDQLLKWCRQSPENLVSLAEFLTEGKNVERLDWSPVALNKAEPGEFPVESVPKST